MVEPDVALTDFAIAIAAVVFAFMLARGRPEPVRRAFIWLFVFTGAAALVGGIAHGFFDLSVETASVRMLWVLTMAFTGAVGAALWLAAAALVAPPRIRMLVRSLIIVEWIAYFVWVVWVDPSFKIAIIQYTVPAFALLIAFGWFYVRQRHPVLLIGIAALLLTFVAGGLQQVSYTPIDALSHNAFFHVLQLIALAGLFVMVKLWTEDGF